MFSIVIINYNTAALALQAMQCVLDKERNKERYELYIVDNGSNDSFMFDNALPQRVHLIKIDKNLGFSGAVNFYLEKVKNIKFEAHLFMNTDVFFDNAAASIMFHHLMEHKNIGGVAPCVLNDKNEKVNYYHKRIKGVFDLISEILFFKRVEMDKKMKGEQEFFIHNGTLDFCCLMIKSEALKKIDNFDDSIFLLCEEPVLCEKFNNNEYSSGFVNTAIVHHLEHQTLNETSKGFRIFHSYMSKLYYFKKYRKKSKFKLYIYMYISGMLIYVKHKSTDICKKHFENAKKIIKCPSDKSIKINKNNVTYIDLK